MVFPASSFGRRTKTTQLRYIWPRIIYLFIYLFIFAFKNILIRVDRAFDSLSHSFCFENRLVKIVFCLFNRTAGPKARLEETSLWKEYQNYQNYMKDHGLVRWDLLNTLEKDTVKAEMFTRDTAQDSLRLKATVERNRSEEISGRIDFLKENTGTMS